MLSSNVSNVHPSFPLETSNSFQVPNLDFPHLQPSNFFIQASKSNSKNFPIQSQSSPSIVSTLHFSSSFPYSQYVRKPKTLEISFIESELNFEEIPKILPYIFFQGVNFNLNGPLKTCQFYEFILVDTDSVEITHNIDRNNHQRIALSKCQILRVMSITDWNKKPSTCKVFCQPFHPMNFNYINYMNA